MDRCSRPPSPILLFVLRPNGWATQILLRMEGTERENERNHKTYLISQSFHGKLLLPDCETLLLWVDLCVPACLLATWILDLCLPLCKLIMIVRLVACWFFSEMMNCVILSTFCPFLYCPVSLSLFLTPPIFFIPLSLSLLSLLSGGGGC